jgi:hypothetical protein
MGPIIDIFEGSSYYRGDISSFEEFLENTRNNNIDFSKITGFALWNGDLSGNSLDFLRRCTNLTSLRLSNVNLREIPLVVWTLTNLTHLRCEGNPIDHIPVELALLPNLQSFTSSQHLYEKMPIEYRNSHRAMINHCRAQLQRRWFTQYMFFALRCSDPVVHAQDMILVDLSYHMCFPGFPGS